MFAVFLLLIPISWAILALPATPSHIPVSLPIVSLFVLEDSLTPYSNHDDLKHSWVGLEDGVYYVEPGGHDTLRLTGPEGRYLRSMVGLGP